MIARIASDARVAQIRDQQFSAILASCGFHLSQRSEILQTLAPNFKMAGADDNEVERILLEASCFKIMALLKRVMDNQRKGNINMRASPDSQILEELLVRHLCLTQRLSLFQVPPAPVGSLDISELPFRIFWSNFKFRGNLHPAVIFLKYLFIISVILAVYAVVSLNFLHKLEILRCSKRQLGCLGHNVTVEVRLCS